MELSLRWAKRCITEFERLANPNALFGIVQGGMFENLREESLAALVDMNLPGYAVGSVSVRRAQRRNAARDEPHRAQAALKTNRAT